MGEEVPADLLQENGVTEKAHNGIGGHEVVDNNSSGDQNNASGTKSAADPATAALPPPTTDGNPSATGDGQQDEIPSSQENRSGKSESEIASESTAINNNESLEDSGMAKVDDTKSNQSNNDPQKSSASPTNQAQLSEAAEANGLNESFSSVDLNPTVVEIPPLEASSEPAADDAASQALLVDLQSSLQKEMELREIAEEKARSTVKQMASIMTQIEKGSIELDKAIAANERLEQEKADLSNQLRSALSDRTSLQVELEKLREARDEFERKEVVLSSRLNAAKKKEASKANLVEGLQDEIKALKGEVESLKSKVQEANTTADSVKESAATMQKSLEERVKKAENLAQEERRLNDERKKKMKTFVETKQEDLRQSRAQIDELNLELSQSNRSMREHHSRWKQLHAQWVQSQTRNRELQRDLNRIKKDSENMSKLGDHMTMQLSRSAQETEEHKNKRLTAKNELMTVLRSLEMEKEMSSKLRDSVKFTFTPKALSQQQLLRESLQELESELNRLSLRLGRPLLPPPRSSDQLFTLDESSHDANSLDSPSSSGGRKTRSEIDTQHLLANLEDETQRVSQGIMALGSSIERFHQLLDDSGDRTCFTALTDFLGTASVNENDGNEANEAASMSGPRLGLGATRNYGQIPNRINEN